MLKCLFLTFQDNFPDLKGKDFLLILEGKNTKFIKLFNLHWQLYRNFSTNWKILHIIHTCVIFLVTVNVTVIRSKLKLRFKISQLYWDFILLFLNFFNTNLKAIKFQNNSLTHLQYFIAIYISISKLNVLGQK